MNHMLCEFIYLYIQIISKHLETCGFRVQHESQQRTCRATQSLLPFTSSKPNSSRMPRPDKLDIFKGIDYPIILPSCMGIIFNRPWNNKNI